MDSYVLAIDQGTTGTTAMVVSSDARVVGKSTIEFAQHYPRPGWVEHQPDELWASVIHAIESVLTQNDLSPQQICAIGITNQRETTLLWQRDDGTPVYPAIVWQDRRTTAICEELKEAHGEEPFRQKTGLVVDPYFSGTKLTWLFRENPSLRAKASRSELLFGTVDSYLVWRLTAKKAHLTDVTNASRTLLFDIHQMRWDQELAEMLQVPVNILPRVCSCSEVYGHTQGLNVLPDGIPICGMAGDQHAALFGQTCFERGDAKCTYGTGAFLLVNIGEKPLPSVSGLITSVAWSLNGKPTYCLEGSSFIAGAAVQWLRDELKIIETSSQIEQLAAQVNTSDGVVFIPAFTGLGAPHWNPRARGSIFGLTRGTSRSHLARATLEGIALQIFELSRAMEQDLGRQIASFNVDGGASANHLLMQLQADVLDQPVVVPKVQETTALGAAFLAGLCQGIWPDLDSLRTVWEAAATYHPALDPAARKTLIKNWQQAVQLLNRM